MTQPRVPETDHGILGHVTVAAYDAMQRRLRDKGWIQTGTLIQCGITQGYVLEIGPGPGYLGLEWLKRTSGTRLKGLDISPDMVALAERNARQYGLADRTEYVCSSGNRMPFDDDTFDAVFTNGSLHEWANPRETFEEMGRVCKPGGKVFISDLRRDMAWPIRWFLSASTQPPAMRAGLATSIAAAYTPAELEQLIRGTQLANGRISGNRIGLILLGTK